MEDQNSQKGKEKCRELGQRGGVPRAYAKWAAYLIPGYRAYWDSEWKRLLLAEEERLRGFEKSFEEFEQEMREKVEWLERDYAPISKVAKNKNIIPRTKSKSK